MSNFFVDRLEREVGGLLRGSHCSSSWFAGLWAVLKLTHTNAVYNIYIYIWEYI